jgi:hypothetical protein
MTVSADEIRSIRPGSTEAFPCDVDKMYSVATQLSTIKRRGLPEGVVDYEHKKIYDRNIIIIRAMREGDEPILNK